MAKKELDLQQYQRLKNDGFSPVNVYLEAKNAGETELNSLIILRKVFEISSREAKEISIKAYDENGSIADNQQKIAEQLKKLVDNETGE